MKRRELMLLEAGALTASPALRAQRKAMPVIGYLASGTSDAAAPLVAAFRQGLSEAGYVEAQNVAIERRQAEGRDDRLPALAADLVDRKVDLIYPEGAVALRAAKNATSTIPILFVVGADPWNSAASGVRRARTCSTPSPGFSATVF